MVMGIIIAFINCFMFVGRGEEKMAFAASVGLLCNGNRVMLIMTSEFEKIHRKSHWNYRCINSATVLA